MTVRITPARNNNSEIVNNKVETINVGNLGTKPVLKYSINIGYKKIIPDKATITEMKEKNEKGL